MILHSLFLITITRKMSSIKLTWRYCCVGGKKLSQYRRAFKVSSSSLMAIRHSTILNVFINLNNRETVNRRLWLLLLLLLFFAFFFFFPLEKIIVITSRLPEKNSIRNFSHHSSSSYTKTAFPSPCHCIIITGTLVSILNSNIENNSHKKNNMITNDAIHNIHKIEEYMTLL